MHGKEFGVISLPDHIGWIFLGAVILYFGTWIFAHFYKGKIREIIVVKKRTTVRNFLRPPVLGSHSNSTYINYVNQTVDFRYVGKKMLHTKVCNTEEIYNKLDAGKTYTVRIKFSWINKIYPK